MIVSNERDKREGDMCDGCSRVMSRRVVIGTRNWYGVRAGGGMKIELVLMKY